MTVSQESLVLHHEARIADDEARLAELNARHKAVCSWTGYRRPRELRIIEKQIRDTTKHKTEHQQRLRRISNAPPQPSSLSGQQHNEPKIAESVPVQAAPKQKLRKTKLQKIRIDCDLSYNDLAELDKRGTLDAKLVSEHCRGKRVPRLRTARIYVEIFKTLGKDIAIKDLIPQN